MLLFLGVGCAKEKGPELWDMETVPLEVKIAVIDEGGNNILDPTKASKISSNVIKATFKGRTYERDKAAVAGISLSTVVDENKVPAILVFGQISGAQKLEDEPLTIDWGDGTETTITLYNTFTWVENASPKFERHIFYDGKDWTDKPFVQVMKKSSE